MTAPAVSIAKQPPHPALSPWILDLVGWLDATNYSRATVRSRRRNLARFAIWCTGRGINPRGAALCPVPISIQGEEVCMEMPSARNVREEKGRNGEQVGPVLQGGAAAQAVVAAIRTLNRQVEVLDRGAYLRVLVPGRCLVTRAAIEAELRAPFRLPGDLERVMPSFKGRLSLSDEQAC